MIDPEVSILALNLPIFILERIPHLLVLNTVARFEKIEWKSEELIVNYSSVSCCGTKKHKEVTIWKQYVQQSSFKLIVEHYQHRSREEDQRSVTKVTEHESEQERESNHRYHSRIGFLITRNSVGVCNLLKHVTEFIWLEEGRLHYLVVIIWLDLRSVLLVAYLVDYIRFILHRGPKESNESLTLSLHHIQVLIQSFFLG